MDAGFYCEFAQIQVVLPKKDRKLDKSIKWLIIGYPGVGGIDFRYKTRSSDKNIYAYYPMEKEYVLVASSISDLIEKWQKDMIIL